MATSIFYSLDKNKDGKISFKEMLESLFPEASQEDIRILLRMARPQVRELWGRCAHPEILTAQGVCIPDSMRQDWMLGKVLVTGRG